MGRIRTAGRIDRAFILAAGFGTRLRPYTDTLPKPMVPVAGRPIIDHALDALAAAGVEEVVVNLHHKGAVLESHLSGRKCPKITCSWEKDLLDTGGGVRLALDFFQNEAFYVLNGDALWQEGPEDAMLDRLASAWDPARMDLLLLLYPAKCVPGGSGDYDRAPDGRLRRSSDKTGEWMFAGVRIAHPGIFQNTPSGAFPFLTLMDAAEKQGLLYGLVHDGPWHHISTPEDLTRANGAFEPAQEERKRHNTNREGGS